MEDLGVVLTELGGNLEADHHTGEEQEQGSIFTADTLPGVARAGRLPSAAGFGASRVSESHACRLAEEILVDRAGHEPEAAARHRGGVGWRRRASRGEVVAESRGDHGVQRGEQRRVGQVGERVETHPETEVGRPDEEAVEAGRRRDASRFARPSADSIIAKRRSPRPLSCGRGLGRTAP